MDKQEEKDLIDKAKLNPRYFEELYNVHFPLIFRFIIRRVNDNEVAADITSQVFLNALKHLKRYQHLGAPFSSWLYKIAHNEVKQYYRRTAQQRQVVLTDNIIEQMKVETGIQMEDMFNRLAEGLQTLRNEALQLIEMRFFENRSFKEIASILEITENNAKVRTYRVLDKLKKNMEDVSI